MKINDHNGNFCALTTTKKKQNKDEIDDVKRLKTGKEYKIYYFGDFHQDKE